MQDLLPLPEESGALVAARLSAWAEGIAHEITFWDEVARTGGRQWPEDFRARMSPQTPVAAWIVEAARAQGGQARVLDVGAGPVTVLGHAAPADTAIEIVATDPLAEAYARIHARHGLTSPNPTRFAFAEYLSAQFEAESFDIVDCRNALDHAIDPMTGLVEMLRVVKPGGLVVLEHARNEAETQGYGGFHHHNFEVREGRFVIWQPGREPVDVAAALPVPALVRAKDVGWVQVRIRKRGRFARERAGRDRARLDALAEGVARVLVARAEQALEI
jgi:SAM-dependent methyltransferase